jgi:hypothetical protein
MIGELFRPWRDFACLNSIFPALKRWAILKNEAEQDGADANGDSAAAGPLLQRVIRRLV